MPPCHLFAGIITLWLSVAVLPAQGQGTSPDYERSRNLRATTQNKVFKDRVNPHWLADNNRFWYRNDLRDGTREYILVDAVKGERRAAFDYVRLAAALTKATDEKQRPAHLSVEELDFVEDGAILRFRIKDKRWRCDLKTYALTEDKAPASQTPPAKKEPDTPPRRRPGGPGRSNSPDRKWTVFVKDHNLYLRERESGKELALSQDGKADDAYSGRVFWSPDGKKLVALRTKKGQEHKVHLIESSPRDQLQPKLHSFDYLKPGDRVALTKPHLFDVAARKEIPVKDELFANPWSVQDVRWTADSRRFTFLYNQRGHQVLRVVAVDAQTGAARAILDERSKTFIDYSGKFFAHYLDATNEIIWMSERDGWNHLYLYDAHAGQVKNQITKGQWVVRGVERVDDKARQIWFRAGGIYQKQDPYYLHYCRVNFDGSGLVVLTEGDGTHHIEYSPDRRFLIDTYSRVDMAPAIELRRVSDGKRICELERADMSTLREMGWKTPERFIAKGRDDTTDIYGVIFRPSNFDAHKKYPVIEQIYAGPQGAFVPKDFRAFHSPQALAELGFVVVQIDGMGTNNRSKAFHDVCWKNLGDAGFPDRIRWLKAAAAKYPSLDLQRVGIYGGSAGGQNALGGVLFHADFYKVAVANCGCHDNRMDKIWWNELWMGWPIGPHYAEQSNVTNAHKLRGKLLLIVGELDRNVDPASTMQVVNALIKAGKDFDLLVVPGAGHGAGGGYAARRQQDFFVRHLLGVEPPDRNALPAQSLRTSGKKR
ncbi:MAG TPA: DPP IV N-terminal domain-containing protein [Gemmataceae bacterium]|nr:DPP IV N-terminal domain-containing protein [Gemmataceae bacterium]